jgi:predicted DNA-binding protein (MmcQ/YjbR family)
MDAEKIREYALGLNGVEEGFPFDNETLVFKVGGKMFLLLSLDSQPLRMNVKCEPDRAIELRGTYSYVLPGYHMNKTHWNTVVCEVGSKPKFILEWILESYNLILNSLPKKTQEIINGVKY